MEAKTGQDRIEKDRMTGQTWKRQKLEELRTRIKIEEHILRSLRAELEELQWLDRRAAELRCGWDIALTSDEQDLRQVEEEFAEIWLAGEHVLKNKSTGGECSH